VVAPEARRVIATRRGLGILVAIAALLAVLLVRELRHRARGGAPIDRSILPGIDLAHVQELRWERGPLPAITLTHDHDRWQWAASGARAEADGTVVSDALAAIRAGRWHRAADLAAAGTVHARLAIVTPDGTRLVGFGEPLAGTEQAWIVAGERALLVDRWIVRALDVDPLALRIRRLVPDPAAAAIITLGTNDETTRLEGHPRRMLSPHVLLVRPALIANLEAALGQLEIVRLSRPPEPSHADVYVNPTPRIQLRAVCPDDPALAWAETTVGDGCVTRVAYDATRTAVAAFEALPENVIEQRLAPYDVETIKLADGVTLDLTKRAKVGAGPAEPDRVAELLAVLSAPAEISTVRADAPIKGHIAISLRGGPTLILELLGNGLVRRELEPLALRLTPAAYALLTRASAIYADDALWSEEPTTITSIKIDGVTYTRGAVIGEWTRTPAGPLDAARVDALVAALAVAHGGPDVESFSKQHEVILTVTAPASAPVTHTLLIGAPRALGCIAHTGTAALTLRDPVCASITALAR
jgi:hypothetical protein